MTESTKQTLGRYEIRGEVGRGGFAVVYRALDTSLEREVALKVLKPAWLDEPRAVERFMLEAKQAARLKHDNIVTIYDVGQAEGRLFIAMELVQGRSLHRVVAEDGPLAWDRALPILGQAARALEHAHRQGLIHRDVKPANILLDEGGTRDHARAVLTDFGLVRGTEQASMSVSAIGGVIGTPEYIAPEMWDGQPASKSSDVYALACAAHFVLTGQVLFGGPTTAAIIKRHMDGPVFPREWPKNVPVGVVAVLQRALARDPAQRYSSASQFIADLEALAVPAQPKRDAGQMPIRPPEPEPRRQPPKEPERRFDEPKPPQKPATQPGAAFVRRWVLANVVAALGTGLFIYTGGPASPYFFVLASQNVVFWAILGAINGLAFGIAEWLVLRPWVPRASRWIGYSVVSTIAAVGADIVLFRFEAFASLWPGIVYGAVGGFIVSYMFHRHYRYARSIWVAIGVVGNLVTSIVGSAFPGGGSDTQTLFRIAVSSAIYGLIAGVGLMWLLRNPVERA